MARFIHALQRHLWTERHTMVFYLSHGFLRSQTSAIRVGSVDGLAPTGFWKNPFLFFVATCAPRWFLHHNERSGD